MTDAAPRIIHGGMPTIFVGDLDRAVDFYTTALGLELLHRAGDQFALVDLGAGVHLGLHPATPDAPAPGTAGAIQLSLRVVRPLEEVIDTLGARGVQFIAIGGEFIIDDGAVRLAFFADPDGNLLYFNELPTGADGG